MTTGENISTNYTGGGSLSANNSGFNVSSQYLGLGQARGLPRRATARVCPYFLRRYALTFRASSKVGTVVWIDRPAGGISFRILSTVDQKPGRL